MAFQVTWTKIADQGFYEIVSFLSENWDSKIVNRYIDKVYDTIDRLQYFPEMGMLSEKENAVRTVLIRPYTRIYYQLNDDVITILRLVDTRREQNE